MFNSLAILQERNVRLTILPSLRISFARQTLTFGSYVGIICGKPNCNKGTYWSCQAHKLEHPHLPNPTKLGSIVHSHCLHRHIHGYWQYLQELILAEAAQSTLLLEDVQIGWGLVPTTLKHCVYV